MGAREMPAVLVRLADAAGNSIEITDAKLASPFLKDYTDAIGRMPTATMETSALLQAIPNIGQVWPGEGGINAGLRRGLDGGPDYYLILHPDALKASKWDDAVAWAKDLKADGHTDFRLPLRADQSLLFSNVPELFEKEWYWSGEQAASDPATAWYQSFSYGIQFNGWKLSDFRARAVRRLVI
jgi:hypothetical protein